MTRAMTGGMNAEPSAMPAMTSEFANARSEGGIHTPTADMATGAEGGKQRHDPPANGCRWKVVCLRRHVISGQHLRQLG
jgi:hypothetical protein